MKRTHLVILLSLFLLFFLFPFYQLLPGIYGKFIRFSLYFISMVTSIFILFGKKKVELKIAWIVVVLCLPGFGFLLYFLFGIEYQRRSRFDSKRSVDETIEKMLLPGKEDCSLILEALGEKKEIPSLIQTLTGNQIWMDTKTEILNNGDVKFAKMIQELKKAEKFIHMEYFIIGEGKIWNQIKQILIAKAYDGVEVRLLYDDFGCIKLSKKEIKYLKKHRIQVGVFNQLSLLKFHPSFNYRNHRKIVIIDNKVAFTGGINIGDEYMHLDPYYGFWRDTHLFLAGKAVFDLQKIFIQDWYHVKRELLCDKPYRMIYPVENKKSSVQVFADGPDNKDEVMRNVIFKLMCKASFRLWITVPYLILDQEFIRALKVASFSGVDVRILVPGRADKNKQLIYLATQSYFSELLECGIKIYTYNNHFIHSKIIIVDDSIASVGTVNLDYRSFDLNFEDSVMLYCDTSIRILVHSYEEDLKYATEVIKEEWEKRDWKKKVLESIIRLFSPLL